MLENEVTAIAESEPGKILFGHENDLTFFEYHNFTTLSFSKDKPESEIRSRVLDLKVDQEKNIWIAASMLRLAKIKPEGRIVWFRKDTGFEDMVTSVLVDKQNLIWVSDRKGLHIFNGEKFAIVDIDILPATETGQLFPYIRKIIQGSGSTIFLQLLAKEYFFIITIYGIIILAQRTNGQIMSILF